jgi:Uma2 family endonuclease
MYQTHTPLSGRPYIPLVEDDTEEAPWMVMGDAQFWAASYLATSLDAYAQANARPWYVASMLPILYRRPGEVRTRQVAPDVFVAFVPRRARESYDLEVEGAFPPFVLEVLSPSSVTRDLEQKRRLYRALDAREYVLFAPEPHLAAFPLQGYRRSAVGRFERWLPDASGRLWSDVLGLGLAAEGRLLRALHADGQPLPTYAESETARAQEAEARQRAEAEVAQLRALLEQRKVDE